jgi:hypothetical protein
VTDADVTGATLLLTDLDNLTANYGQTFVLIKNNGSNAITGSFAGLTRSGGVADSYTVSTGAVRYTLFYSYNSDLAVPTPSGGNDLAIQFSAVPEPGALGLIGLAGLATLRRRQRRK